MDNEVRRKMASSPEELMRDFLDEDIGDERHDIYTGIVVNNNDPEKNGKVQIRVYGVFEDNVSDSDLPWALPDFSFVGSLVGNFTVPPVGTKVNVYFDKGDIYFPHYFSKSVQKSKQPKQKDIDYPDNVVFFETDANEYFTINRLTNVTKYHHNSGNEIVINGNSSTEFKHKSGTIIKIDESGNVIIENKIGTSLNYGGNSSFVTPDSSKFGPFCALPFDTLTGLPLQGNMVIRTG